MAWVAVNKNGDEWLYEHKPIRNEELGEFRSRNMRNNIGECGCAPLEKGSIYNVTGLRLTWYSDPVKI